MSSPMTTEGGGGIVAEMDSAITDSRSHPYQLFMLVLCLYVLLALMAQTFFPLPPDVVVIFDAVDTGICALFFADFLGNLVFRKDRLAYLKWGWIDLISSIPGLDFLRWGRLARIIRILRVLRAVRSTRMLATYVLKRRAESTVLAVALVSMLLLVFASVAVLNSSGAAEDRFRRRRTRFGGPSSPSRPSATATCTRHGRGETGRGAPDDCRRCGVRYLHRLRRVMVYGPR